MVISRILLLLRIVRGLKLDDRKTKNRLQSFRKFRLPEDEAVILPFPAEIPFYIPMPFIVTAVTATIVTIIDFIDIFPER